MVKPCILILIDSLSAGGMERQVIELLKGLRQGGRFRLALGVLEHGGQLEDEALSLADLVLRLQRRRRFDLSVPCALARQARVHKIRLIHAYGVVSSVAALAATRLLRVPLIVSIRSAPSHLSAPRRIVAWCGRLADAVVSNSRAGLVSYGLENHRCAHGIPNGVDMARFADIVPAERLSGEQVVGMVANFSPLKDHATVVHAMRDLHREFPTLRLVLVGRDRGTLGETERLVRELGLDGITMFITDTNRPQPYVAASDVCVLATNTALHGEGISNAILEYMALAKPVVATDCGGNHEVVVDGVTGYLVPPRAPEVLAERVAQLLRTPRLAAKMGQLGRERVRTEFPLERMVSQHERLYASLLSSRQGTITPQA